MAWIFILATMTPGSVIDTFGDQLNSLESTASFEYMKPDNQSQHKEDTSSRYSSSENKENVDTSNSYMLQVRQIIEYFYFYDVSTSDYPSDVE